MAVAFLQLENIEAWLRDGMSPLEMKGAIGVLLLSPAVEPAIQKQLRGVRAFLDRNESLLKDPLQWPVEHMVWQLASQEPGLVLPATGSVTPDKNAPLVIEWINKPQVLRRERMTFPIHSIQGSLWRDVAYFSSGRKLAYLCEFGKQVVVFDTETGFIDAIWRPFMHVVRISSSDDLLAAGTKNGYVLLYDTQTKEVKSTVNTGFTVSYLFVSRTDNRIAAGDWDGNIAFFDTKGEVILPPISTGTGVTCVSFSGHGLVAAGNEDGDVRLYSFTGALQWTSNVGARIFCLAFSPGNDLIAAGDGHANITVFDTVGEKKLSLQHPYAHEITVMAFDPTGQVLAFAIRTPASGCDLPAITLWDVQTGGLTVPTFIKRRWCVSQVFGSALL